MPGILIQYHFHTDRRTARALAEAERIGGKLTITQGSWSTSVGASGGTHAGGGVLDFSVRGLTMTQINRRVWALRTVGIWAWYRPALEGVWGPHIHAICVGCSAMSDAARRQIAAAKLGRDGLAGNRLDRHRGMGLEVVTWEEYVARVGLLGGRVLKEGMRGRDVRKVQRKLGIVVDGRFGVQTERAVLQFQRKNKLKVTGTVNAATVRELQEAA